MARDWIHATAPVLLALASTTCSVAAAHDEPLAQPSRARFADEAGPLLSKRCGDVSCHGVAEHPYSIFTLGRRRIDPADTYSSKPLSLAEVDANYKATLGFLDAPRGRDTTLIRKALGLGGPGGHRGGAVFEAPSDPECVAILAWIEGGP